MTPSRPSEPMDRNEALAMEGTGWDADLEELRGAAQEERVTRLTPRP